MAKSSTPKTDNETAAIASIGCLENYFGVQKVDIETSTFNQSKVKDGIRIAGEKASLSPMEEAENKLLAVKVHISTLQTSIMVTPMVERYAGHLKGSKSKSRRAYL